MSLRGTPIPLVDLGRFLQLGHSGALGEMADDPLAEKRIVIVSTDAYKIGLQCDKVHGVLQAEPGAIKATGLTSGGRLRDFTIGEIDSPHGIVGVLDLESLLAASRAHS